MTFTEFSLSPAGLTLMGAVCGDVIGSSYEFYKTKKYDFQLFKPRSRFTDDTVCTVAVADSLLHDIPFDKSLQKWGLKYLSRGYGGSFRQWLTSENPMPYNSWGNGSAMRVSAAGAAAGSIEEALELAKKSAEVTHDHPEGIKGAQAVAAAVFMALHGSTKQEIKDFITQNIGYDLSRNYEDIKPGYKFEVSCQKSVPESIICFLESTDYESAIRLAVSMGGDADTMGAIAGSIAAAFYKEINPSIFKGVAELLTDDIKEIIIEFSEKYNRDLCQMN